MHNLRPRWLQGRARQERARDFGQAAHCIHDRSGKAIEPVFGHRGEQRFGGNSAAAQAFGADILVRRPDELANDSAPKVPVIHHCLEVAECQLGRQFPVFIDLDVTSPLRLPEDIVGAARLLEQRGVSSVITGTPARRSPYFNIVELDERGVVHLSKDLARPVVRRQDGPHCYDMNASIYVWRRDVFHRNPAVFYDDTLLFEMPEERSIDIDSELDFEIVRMLLIKRAQAPA